MDPATTTRPLRLRLTRRLSTTLGAFGVTATLLLGQCQPQCAPAPSAPAPSTASATQQVIDLANARRAENGLPALAASGALAGVAQGHSNDQAARDRMGHDGSDGSGPGDRIARAGYPAQAWGENVAAGYPDAASVMQGWMDSPGHRDNILSGNVTEIGIGLASAGDGTPYWTMVVARPG